MDRSAFTTGCEQAWDAAAKTDPPRPARQRGPSHPCSDDRRLNRPRASHPQPGVRALLIHSSGNIKVRRIQFYIHSRRADHTVHVIETTDTVTFTDIDGNVPLERPWPAPGNTYVSNGHPAARASHSRLCHRCPDTSHASRNQARFLKAGREAFGRGRFDISFRAVADRAEVSAATAYRHFPKSTALLAAVVGNQLDSC